MQSPTIITVIKMMETLPEAAQAQVADHLREYIAELQDEMLWDRLFEKTQPQLEAATRRVREQIANGEATPMLLEEV